MRGPTESVHPQSTGTAAQPLTLSSVSFQVLFFLVLYAAAKRDVIGMDDLQEYGR